MIALAALAFLSGLTVGIVGCLIWAYDAMEPHR